jgi:hypothetical protein
MGALRVCLRHCARSAGASAFSCFDKAGYVRQYP